MVSPVDKLLWCDNSDEIPGAAPLQGKICLPVHVLYEMPYIESIIL